MPVSLWDGMNWKTGPLLDDLDRRPTLRAARPGGGRVPLRDGRQGAIEGEVEIDLAGGVAAVEPELPVVGPQDVAVLAAVGVDHGPRVQDARGDQVFQRLRILAGGIVEDANGALDRRETAERHGF